MRTIIANMQDHGPGAAVGMTCSNRQPSAAWWQWLLTGLLALAILVLWLSHAPLPAREHKVFVVSAIPVDVTAEDATRAKIQAILQAQREAFFRLLRRLAGEKAAERLQGVSDRDIGRLLSSLSIADEHTGPRRYIARISVHFNPRKLLRLLRAKGIAVVTRQAPPVLVVPVWEEPDGPVLWQDNPWLKAWRKLADDHALVPIIVPAGDEVDRNAISAQEAFDGDKRALQALQMRYGADYLLTALARPQGNNAVQAAMIGPSPGGKVTFDKIYQGQDLEQAAERAARRFIEVLTIKWRRKVWKEEQERRQAEAMARAATRITMIVPFATLREWQQLRGRLATTPGVNGVDVQSLSGTHAVVTVTTSLSPQDLQRQLALTGLDLRSKGGRWYLHAR